MTGTITKYKRRGGGTSWGYYYKFDGRNHTRQGFATKDEARTALDQAIAAAQGRDLSIPVASPMLPAALKDTRTVSEFLDYWLSQHAALRCAPKTLERYHDLARYLKRAIGTIGIADLKTAHIQEALNRLQLHGGITTKEHPEGRPLAGKTIRSIATLLHGVLADGVRLEILPVNPMADKRIRLPKRAKPNPAVLDPASLGKLFEAARGTRLHPFVVLAASSGCRRGELLALTWRDVDFQKGVITISKSLEQTRAGLRVKSTKSGEPRFVGLEDFELDVLADHRD